MKIRLGKTGKHTVSCAWSMGRANSFDEMRQDKMYSAEQSRAEQCSGVQSRAVQCSRVQGCESEYRVYRAIHTVKLVIRTLYDHIMRQWEKRREENNGKKYQTKNDWDFKNRISSFQVLTGMVEDWRCRLNLGLHGSSVWLAAGKIWGMESKWFKYAVLGKIISVPMYTVGTLCWRVCFFK